MGQEQGLAVCHELGAMGQEQGLAHVPVHHASYYPPIPPPPGHTTLATMSAATADDGAWATRKCVVGLN